MTRIIKVFFAFQFKDAHISKVDRESALIAAVKDAREEIEKDFSDYHIEWQECQLESGKQIGEQIIELVTESDIFISDISEFNLNVLFELGVACGLQHKASKRILWLVHEAVDLTTMPSDLRGLYVHRYDNQSLRPLLTQKIRDFAIELIVERLTMEQSLAILEFWGLPDEGNIDIVCSEIPPKERHYFADPKDRNYLRYAKFADLDTLICVRTRIAQLFPCLGIRDFSPSEYFDTNTKGLIVIGGPPWNSKFREFQPQLPFNFVPRKLGEDDPLQIHLIENCFLYPTWKDKNHLLRDISLFAKIQLHQSLPVFLLGGCLTFGVLGAAKAFLDESHAKNNVNIIAKYIEDQDFIVVFETMRTGGIIQTPNFTFNNPLVILSRSKHAGAFELVLDNSDNCGNKRDS